MLFILNLIGIFNFDSLLPTKEKCFVMIHLEFVQVYHNNHYAKFVKIANIFFLYGSFGR
jgi:hypothetical protein